MICRVFSTLVAVLVFLFSVQPSFAEFYVSGNIGMLFLPDRETTEIFPIELGWYNSDANSVTGGSFTSTEEFDEGIRITGAIGTHIFDAVRVEFEAGYANTIGLLLLGSGILKIVGGMVILIMQLTLIQPSSWMVI